MIFRYFIFVFIYLFSIQAESANSCGKYISTTTPESLNTAIELSHKVAEQIDPTAFQKNSKASSKKGYAILIGTMVGSAALSTYLGAKLPSELQFTSIFIAQVSTVGVFIFGAPIWEPLSSKFRKWAFGISNNYYQLDPTSKQLEDTWSRTQELYSLNSQMSRNLINQFILSAKENFYQAYRAHKENNPEYSADQVAEAAYRMRILFRDISPTDKSVASAINTAFTNHVLINRDFIEVVWVRLKMLDKDFSQPEVETYYNTILKVWLSEI